MDIVVDIVDNHFNPRLREGGDFSSLSSVDGETISIHASAKEATESNQIAAAYINISIHASAKEATNLKIGTDGKFEFQSTPPRRRRPRLIDDGYLLFSNFNPRLREGGDRGKITSSAGLRTISIHASAKEATLRYFSL